MEKQKQLTPPAIETSLEKIPDAPAAAELSANRQAALPPKTEVLRRRSADYLDLELVNRKAR